MSASEEQLRKARRSIRFHRTMAVVWTLLLVPSLLWWKDSLLWVIIMSQYANLGAHWSAAKGAEAALRAQEG